jgi:cupin fold WbuC family metalloprotein
MNMHAESPEVFYPEGDPVIVGQNVVEILKHAALTSSKKRARLCTHTTPADRLHEMLIVLPRGAYVRPHKHIGKIESFTILEGEADVILFGEDGTIRQRISMGCLGSGKAFYYRLSSPVFHTLVVRSEFLVFHEVTEGPFRTETTVFADWSPDDRDASVSSAYLTALLTNALP